MHDAPPSPAGAIPSIPAVLAEFFCPNIVSLPTILANHKLSPQELLEYIRQPEHHAALEAIQELNRIRAQFALAHARADSIGALRRIQEHYIDQLDQTTGGYGVSPQLTETARKATAHLLALTGDLPNPRTKPDDEPDARVPLVTALSDQCSSNRTPSAPNNSGAGVPPANDSATPGARVALVAALGDQCSSSPISAPNNSGAGVPPANVSESSNARAPLVTALGDQCPVESPAAPPFSAVRNTQHHEPRASDHSEESSARPQRPSTPANSARRTPSAPMPLPSLRPISKHTPTPGPLHPSGP